MLQENEKVLGEYRPELLRQIQNMSVGEIEDNRDRMEFGRERWKFYFAY